MVFLVKNNNQWAKSPTQEHCSDHFSAGMGWMHTRLVSKNWCFFPAVELSTQRNPKCFTSKLARLPRQELGEIGDAL